MFRDDFCQPDESAEFFTLARSARSTVTQLDHGVMTSSCVAIHGEGWTSFIKAIQDEWGSDSVGALHDMSYILQPSDRWNRGDTSVI